MKNLIKSTLLTVAAVPFLMAAPHAATKAQNAAPAASQNHTEMAKPKVKKVKKTKKQVSTTTTATAPAVQK